MIPGEVYLKYGKKRVYITPACDCDLSIVAVAEGLGKLQQYGQLPEAGYRLLCHPTSFYIAYEVVAALFGPNAFERCSVGDANLRDLDAWILTYGDSHLIFYSDGG